MEVLYDLRWIPWEIRWSFIIVMWGWVFYKLLTITDGLEAADDEV